MKLLVKGCKSRLVRIDEADVACFRRKAAPDCSLVDYFYYKAAVTEDYLRCEADAAGQELRCELSVLPAKKGFTVSLQQKSILLSPDVVECFRASGTTALKRFLKDNFM